MNTAYDRYGNEVTIVQQLDDKRYVVRYDRWDEYGLEENVSVVIDKIYYKREDVPIFALAYRRGAKIALLDQQIAELKREKTKLENEIKGLQRTLRTIHTLQDEDSI